MNNPGQVVAGAIEPEITKAEFERQRHAPPDNLDAWQLYQRGLYQFHQQRLGDAEKGSIAFFQASIKKDPGFSPAYAALARALSLGAAMRLDLDPNESVDLAIATAQRAVALDPDDAHAHAAMGFAFIFRDLGLAEQAFKNALNLNPNFAAAYFGLGVVIVYANRAAEAIASVTTAIQLSPRDPLINTYRGVLGIAHIALGNDETALTFLGGRNSATKVTGRLSAARIVALAHLGHEEEVRIELAKYLEVFPHATITVLLQYLSDLNGRLVTGLRKAGMPE
jgi:adenylate cyclase